MGLKLKPLKKDIYPGPGRYDLEEFKDNNYINSRMTNTKNTIFSPKSSVRFIAKKKLESRNRYLQFNN